LDNLSLDSDELITT